MLSLTTSNILSCGFAELYTIQQLPLIKKSSDALPDSSSLSVFSFLLTDTTISSKMVTAILNLLRRVIPTLPSDYDFGSFYTVISKSTVSDVDYQPSLIYEKVLTLIVLSDYIEDKTLINVYDTIMQYFNETIRLLQGCILETLFISLQKKVKQHNKEVWCFISKALHQRQKLSFLRFIIDVLEDIDSTASHIILPSLIKQTTMYSTEKEFLISHYAHTAITFLLKKYFTTSKAYFETYIYLVFKTILSFDDHLLPSYHFPLNLNLNDENDNFMDLPHILISYISNLFTIDNFVMKTYVNFDCDPHSLSLFGFIIENLLNIQVKYTTLIPNVRTLLIGMLTTIHQGNNTGNELIQKDLKEKNNKIAQEFNKNIENGIKKYQEIYLPNTKEITPQDLNSLKKGKDFNINTLKCYLQEFVQQDLLNGFVKFVQSVALPKETNSINHIFNDYAKYYFEYHPNEIQLDDIELAISAMLLLNVELHHPVMKITRTKEEFINAMKETTPSVQEHIFTEMYEYIENNEFYIPSELPNEDLSRLEEDLLFRQRWTSTFDGSLNYSKKSVDDVVTKIVKPLIQNLQTQLEIANSTTALDHSCQSFLEFAELAKTLKNSVMMDFLATNLIKITTLCNNPDINTFCFDVKPIRASLLLMEIFTKYYEMFNQSISSICKFLCSLKTLDLFPDIIETKQSVLQRVITPVEQQKQNSSWLSWLGGETQIETSIEKTKKLFKTKSHAKHIIVETSQQMNEEQFKLFANGFQKILTTNEGGNKKLAIGSLSLLHYVLYYNWNRIDYIWNDLMDWTINFNNEYPSNHLITILPLSLFDVVDEITETTIKGMLKLLLTLHDDFIQKNVDMLYHILTLIISKTNDNESVHDIIKFLLIHTSQSQIFLQVLCSERISILDSIIKLHGFDYCHYDLMTTLFCNVYKSIASTPFFVQYTRVLTIFYQQIIEGVEKEKEYKETLINNVQTLSLFLFVACCHPNANIRSISLPCLQTTSLQFFNNVEGKVIEMYFKSMATFINGICSKKLSEIPQRCMEMATKIFLMGYSIIMEKSPTVWFILLEIVKKLKESSSINESIKENMKNVMFVLVLNKIIVKDSKDWQESWELLDTIVSREEFEMGININEDIDHNQSKDKENNKENINTNE
ncbi:Sec7 domain protein [Entamoeba marina]